MGQFYSRRQFLKISGATLGGWAMASVCPNWAQLQAAEQAGAKARFVATYCEICFWKCGVVAKVIDNKVVKLEGNPRHPHCRGKLCGRGNGGLGLLYDPDRLKAPLIRSGERGDGHYREATWDEALSLVAEKMGRLAEQYGPESMALFTHGSGTSHFYPLLRAYGSPNVAMPSFAQCRGPRVAAYDLTTGMDIGSPERIDMPNSKVVVLLGSHLGENMHSSQVQDFTQAVANGATIIVVDPRFSTAAGKADHWLPIRPGTDMALLLAWTHLVLKNGWYDQDYVRRYTRGFDDILDNYAEYTPEWAAKETDLSANVIRETARLIARNAPAVALHPGRHATWDGQDVQRERAIIILQALLGTWGRQGGIYLPTTASLPSASPGKAFPKPARQALNRGGYPFAGGEGVTNAVRDATLHGSPYPIKGWFVTGTNLLATLPNQKETLDAIKNLDFLVAVDVMPTDTVMHADVILPECSYLERHDTIAQLKGRDLQIAIRQPVIEPLYNSKPGWWIAKNLADKMGLGEYFPWETFESKLEDDCLVWDVDFDELKSKGVIAFPNTSHPYITADNPPKFKTSSKRIELYSEELELEGFDPVPRYVRNPQPKNGEFRLLYGRSPVHTFTRTVNNPVLNELYSENEVWLNADVAKDMGLKSGDYARLENQDGVISTPVKVKATERIRQDCVYLIHGFGQRSQRLSNAQGRGADDQSLITNYVIDPIAGTTGMRVNFVQIRKEA